MRKTREREHRSVEQEKKLESDRLAYHTIPYHVILCHIIPIHYSRLCSPQTAIHFSRQLSNQEHFSKSHRYPKRCKSVKSRRVVGTLSKG